MGAKNADAEIADDMRPFLVRYKDGRIVRLAASPFVPASEVLDEDGVATRDEGRRHRAFYGRMTVRLFLIVGAHIQH
ncbi:unnamed protein product [Urochloa humidicola]